MRNVTDAPLIKADTKKIVYNDERCGEVTIHRRYVIGNEDDQTRDERWYEKKSEEPKIEHQNKNDSANSYCETVAQSENYEYDTYTPKK
jgi:hypothetical protein